MGQVGRCTLDGLMVVMFAEVLQDLLESREITLLQESHCEVPYSLVQVSPVDVAGVEGVYHVQDVQLVTLLLLLCFLEGCE